MKTLALALGALLCLPAAAVVRAATPGGARAASHTAMQSVPAALRPVLYRALAHDAGPAYGIGKNGCATLPGQRLEGCFTADSANFFATGEFELRLAAWGRGTRLNAVGPIKPRISGNRVTYRRGSLTEWWRVLPVGFEQGFTIARRPAGNSKLMFALSANSKATAKGGVIAFGNLRYGDLVVMDANGKIVPSRLMTQGSRIVITVDDAGARYPLTVDPLVWIEQGVSASDSAAGDYFGNSVSISGDIAMVGSPEPYFGSDGTGAVYVFSRQNGSWTQIQELTASDGAIGDQFGCSVALDGDTAVIGAFEADGQIGAAYVFTSSGGTWAQAAELAAPFGASWFGYAVAISGSTIVVGAPSATITQGYQGAGYAYTGSGGSWTLTGTLVANDAGADDSLGRSVSVSADMALLGAPLATVSGNVSQGAAYIFTNSGGTWSQLQKLTADDGAAADEFGTSVAVVGGTAMVGARGAAINGVPYTGAAYVFDNSGGTWLQSQKLFIDGNGYALNFGQSIGFDGTTAAIGAVSASGAQFGGGAAYVYTMANGQWINSEKLYASDAQVNGNFGGSAAVSDDEILVGANTNRGPDNARFGAAYFYGNANLDLAISAPGSVTQNDNYTSQVIATDSSTTDSPAIAVTATVPAGADFVSANATQGSCTEASSIVSCDFGQLNGNGGTATANITLKASGNSGDTIKNTASISNATPAVAANAPTNIQSSGGGGGGGGGGGSSGGGGGGSTAPLSLLLLGLAALAALTRRKH